MESQAGGQHDAASFGTIERPAAPARAPRGVDRGAEAQWHLPLWVSLASAKMETARHFDAALLTLCERARLHGLMIRIVAAARVESIRLANNLPNDYIPIPDDAHPPGKHQPTRDGEAVRPTRLQATARSLHPTVRRRAAPDRDVHVPAPNSRPGRDARPGLKRTSEPRTG
jgi:hypothetical protein